MTNRRAEAVAENVWVRIVARGAMILGAVGLSLFGWFASEYMKSQDAKSAAILVSVDKIDESIASINSQLAERDLARERIRSEVAIERQRNDEQDRTLGRHESLLADRTRFPYQYRRPE